MLNRNSTLLLATLIVNNFAVAALHDTSGNTPPSKEQATAALSNIAVPFEENRGQTDAKVAFQDRANG